MTTTPVGATPPSEDLPPVQETPGKPTGQPASGIKNLSDLKNLDPEFYEFVLQSLAQEICTKSKSQTDRIIKESKKGRQQ